MAISEVILGSRTLLSLTGDTVSSGKMLSGTTAHDKTGTKITGNIQTYNGSYECAPGVAVAGFEVSDVNLAIREGRYRLRGVAYTTVTNGSPSSVFEYSNVTSVNSNIKVAKNTMLCVMAQFALEVESISMDGAVVVGQCDECIAIEIISPTATITITRQIHMTDPA